MRTPPLAAHTMSGRLNHLMWLFLQCNAFDCEYGERSIACGSCDSLCMALIFRELKKVGHIRTKPPFILPVAEEFFLGKWYSYYV